MKYHCIVSERLVKPESETIYSELCTRIGLNDEAGGLFVYVKQQGRTDVGTVFIDPAEWPTIRQAIDETMAQLK